MGRTTAAGTSEVPDVQAAPRTVTLPAGMGILLHLPRAATTVMVAEPGVARVRPATPTSLFLMGVAPGRTTLIATAEDGAPVGYYDVLVTPMQRPTLPSPPPPRLNPVSAREAQSAVRRLIPGARAVVLEAAAGRLILRGSVPDAMAAQQVEAIARGFVGDNTAIVDEMIVLGGLRVNVRIRVAEISRAITRQLGFNWASLGSGGTWRFGLLTGADGAAANMAPGAPGDPRPSPGLLPLAGGSVTPYRIGASQARVKGDINGVIDALAAGQLVTILAEPTLTTRSGETASFLAGGEFPIPLAGGGGGVTIAFKPFGVSLSLVPTVLSPTRLTLRIRPEVSEMSGNGAVSLPTGNGTLTIPALTVRRADTTVELGSGQSFAIAGLLQGAGVNGAGTLPGIGETPVIGALFRSNSFQRGESELVIIVTPYLVRSADDPDPIYPPAEGFRPANDLDRVLMGRPLGTPPGRPPLNAGFILK